MSRGLFLPGERNFAIRVAATCQKCGRGLTLWRDAGNLNPGAGIRCNGADREECGRIRHAASIARQRLGEPKPAEVALARRHLDRRWTCHRPDKMAYESQEIAEGRVLTLKAASPATTALLQAYPCRCTFWHIGNRPPGLSTLDNGARL